MRLPEPGDHQQEFNIILRGQNGLFGLVIDRPRSLSSLDMTSKHSPPETLNPNVAQRLQSVFSTAEGLLGLLDVDRVSPECL